MLSYDLHSGGIDNPWLRIVGAFQQRVLSTYADENLVAYSRSGAVSRSEFSSVTVTANWDTTNSYSSGGFSLPPSGVLVASLSGDRAAGIFTTYNGVPLSDGDHYLIEERGQRTITVRQPAGANTSLLVRLLPGWSAASPVEVWAFTSSSQFIGRVTPTVTANGVRFEYQTQLSGKNVDHYLVVVPVLTHMPSVCK